MLGIIDVDETLMWGYSVWNCPYCNCMTTRELDASGIITCAECHSDYEIKPFEEMV